MARYDAGALPQPEPYGEPESLQFPGCRPVRISREAITDYEGSWPTSLPRYCCKPRWSAAAKQTSCAGCLDRGSERYR